MFRLLRSVSAEISRLVLGLVLAGASLSKVMAIHPFAGAFSRLTHVPEPVATPAAVVLIGFEFATGLLLLARKRIRFAAPAALFLFLAFTVVLSAAVVRGVDLPCNCFGSLGPRLPARDQAVLDLLFAAVAFFLIMSPRESIPGARKFSVLTRAASLCALLWGSALLVWPHSESGDESPLTASLLGEISPDGSRRPKVILLADFDDFGCQLCLDDFLAFCDSLNGQRFRSNPGIRLIARRDSTRSAAEQARLLEGWAAGNRYLFPVSVDSGGIFEQSGVGKTSAIVIDRDGRLLDIVHFPTGPEKRSGFLRAIGG
jgi:hypothetical protein